ncbi:MAG TPA: hypothetical protein VHD56_15650 [Tepidisphaeraceae bacterium]|nr:hypothetical protein [Tepidisphaeraceae bacterium]
MSDKWMTVAEAATALKVHPRTIERRIAGGKIQTRRADDGLLQVLVEVPDTPDTALETVRELAADQVSLATGSASALVHFAQDEATRARQDLALVRQDVGRARRHATAAWCMVAVLGIGVTIAVGWTASTITRANSDVKHLAERTQQAEAQAKVLAEERDAARQEAEHARLQTAEVSSKLAIYLEEAAKRPTTRPAGLLERIATAIAENQVKPE